MDQQETVQEKLLPGELGVSPRPPSSLTPKSGGSRGLKMPIHNTQPLELKLHTIGTINGSRT